MFSNKEKNREMPNRSIVVSNAFLYRSSQPNNWSLPNAVYLHCFTYSFFRQDIQLVTIIVDNGDGNIVRLKHIVRSGPRRVSAFFKLLK